MRKNVPVLVTCDIDPSPEVSISEKRKSLDKTLGFFENLKIPATFFFVANVAKQYQSALMPMLDRGHEIGCHGLTHELSEEYSRLPEHIQRENLIEATTILQDLTGAKIRSFRGPRVKTSHITQKILDELGYLVDSSVCSQRLDFISSNLINPGWLRAPRLPYHPSSRSAFKKGARNLWVVPVSALILPFISSLLYVMGPALMKSFFKLLYFESRRTGKPIVYLMHPVEFAPHGATEEKASLASIKSRGFHFRRRLKLRVDETRRFEMTHHLLEYMASFEDVKFITATSVVDALSTNPNHLY